MSCDQLKPFRDIDGDIRHELGCPELFVLDLNLLRASMCLFLTRNRAGKTCISIGRMVSIFLELFLKPESPWLIFAFLCWFWFEGGGVFFCFLFVLVKFRVFPLFCLQNLFGLFCLPLKTKFC